MFNQEKNTTQLSTAVSNLLSEISTSLFTSNAGHQISKDKILKLLNPSEWLCDQIINICLERIVSPDIVLKDTFFFVELVSETERLSYPKWKSIFESSKTWAIPVNLGCHWLLMVLRNQADILEIECWDSLPTHQSIEKLRILLVNSYNRLTFAKKQVSFSVKADCYIQVDQSNCGAFMISNIIALVRKLKPCNINPKEARLAIALMIFRSIRPAVN